MNNQAKRLAYGVAEFLVRWAVNEAKAWLLRVDTDLPPADMERFLYLRKMILADGAAAIDSQRRDAALSVEMVHVPHREYGTIDYSRFQDPDADGRQRGYDRLQFEVQDRWDS